MYARSAVRCSASQMKGELNPAKYTRDVQYFALPRIWMRISNAFWWPYFHKQPRVTLSRGVNQSPLRPYPLARSFPTGGGRETARRSTLHRFGYAQVQSHTSGADEQLGLYICCWQYRGMCARTSRPPEYLFGVWGAGGAGLYHQTDRLDGECRHAHTQTPHGRRTRNVGVVC